MNTVTIQDQDIETASFVITSKMRADALLAGTVIPEGLVVAPYRGPDGKKIQNPVNVPLEYSGDHLKRVIQRTKRWLRSKKARMGLKPPRHIRLGIQVLEEANVAV